MPKSNPMATWDMGLNCNCPKCKEYVNLLPTGEDDDTLENFWYQLSTNITQILNNSKNVLVICPECEHVFTVDCEY